MSGGVDSSVAAALMLEAGHEVIGVTLKQWEGPTGEAPTAGCCTVGDAEDARRVAAQLGVPYYVLDYVDEFRAAVVEPFGQAYLRGETPNPCIECNRHVRFRALLGRMTELGCDVLVTGHHARVVETQGRYRLLTGVDEGKDQSYVLYMLGQRELSRVQLPVGDMTKQEVRERAATLGLRTAAKPDSQDLCFVGRGGYRSFLREHYPGATRPGPVVDTSGAVVGAHAGTVDFTIGQRKGIGVAAAEPRYVVGVDPGVATVRIGRREELEVAGCEVADTTFVAGPAPGEGDVTVKVRYRAHPVRARVQPAGGGAWLVEFAQPQLGVAAGQAAVFYRGDEVLGGGTISSTFRLAA